MMSKKLDHFRMEATQRAATVRERTTTPRQNRGNRFLTGAARCGGFAMFRALVVVASLAAAVLGGLVLAQDRGEIASDPSDAFVNHAAALRLGIVAVGAYKENELPSIRYYGTGFIVGDGLTIATNAHVVNGVRETEKSLDDLRVFFVDGRDNRGQPARVIQEDAFHDVALLRFEGPAGRAVSLDSDLPRQGREIGVMGYPVGTVLGLVPALHKGVIAAVVPAVLPLPRGAKLTPELVAAIRNPYDIYQLDITVLPGNSGSPVFDARSGRVIAIVNKALGDKTREHLIERPTGIGYAVPAIWIAALLAKDAAETQTH